MPALKRWIEELTTVAHWGVILKVESSAGGVMYHALTIPAPTQADAEARVLSLFPGVPGETTVSIDGIEKV